MSVSQHPIALGLERRVGGPTRLLATVMGLPLVDGIFPALVIAGALDSPAGVLETGLLVFGGSATVAVVLAEMDDPTEAVPAVLALGAVLVPLAALEAALAPALRSLLAFEVFRRFAGLVILAVAAKTASARVGEYLPRPAVIVGLGVVASVRPAGASLALAADPGLIARAAAAAAVGVGFALAVAALGPWLRGSVDLDRFRFGSAVALGMLALSVLGLMPTAAPVALGVLAVTAVFSFDPDGIPGIGIDRIRGDDAGGAPDGRAAGAADAGGSSGYPIDPGTGAGAGSDADGSPWTGDDDARAPWL
ncbi:MAG: DUF5794 domain-containing protein [Haloferacaceae archaeon]